MVNKCSLSSAQRSYDNQMPDDSEYPDEMYCPECGETVALEDTGSGFIHQPKITGTCKKCGTDCEYDNDQF